MKIMCRIAAVLVWIASMAQPAAALVSEARPGIAYRDQVLFLHAKQVQDGEVVWLTLAYGDPDAARDCRNLIDVFDGRQLFAAIPEKSWVLVDFTLRSLVIQAGFAGDADVTAVTACGDEPRCRALQLQRGHTPVEQGAETAVPPANSPSGPEDAAQRVTLGRTLVKSARCRACHVIEGFGASHAPSLTWRRARYQPGWLAAYLAAPYRLRPALTTLMMLNYTSPLAQPSLQPQEVVLVADYLQRLAWFSPPAGRFRLEPWQTYRCQPCHARLYAERPLVFVPTPVPPKVRDALTGHEVQKACLACHAFGDVQTVAAWPGPPYAYPMAPDLLLALEKLRLDYMVDYVRDPAYLQPGSAMPRLDLTAAQLEEVEAWGRQLQQFIEQGAVRPLHQYYRMQKRP